jgi:protein-S-isoprenylcysteine O-methyltransferase Ste14
VVFRFLENVCTRYIKHNGLSVIKKYTVGNDRSACFLAFFLQYLTLGSSCHCIVPKRPKPTTSMHRAASQKIDDLNYISVLFWGLLSALFVCGVFRPTYGSVRFNDFCRRIARFTFCCNVFTFFTRTVSPMSCSLCPRKYRTLTTAFRYIVRIGYLLLTAGLGLWVCLP